MYLFTCIKEHSQRVPNKNFRILGDKKLYQILIDKIINTKYTLFVDTDSTEIIDYCKGIKNIYCYYRNKKLRGDSVSTDLLIKNCINMYNLNLGYMVHLFVTAPFFNIEVLPKICSNIIRHNLDSMFSANIIKKRLWKRDIFNVLEPINHNPKKLKQTQDLPNIYIENSIFYIFSIKKFKKYGYRICGKSEPLILEYPENIDIDTEEDWELCEKIVRDKIC